MVYIVNYAWEDFMRNPMVTSLDSFDYPVEKVPFPGISVCSVNKISRKRAKKYAELL